LNSCICIDGSFILRSGRNWRSEKNWIARWSWRAEDFSEFLVLVYI